MSAPALFSKSASQLELEPGVWLDARRAVWFAEERVLAVADLHLGYAWGSRAAGTMLPLETPDDTRERLLALAREYQAQELLVLGDIVHKAVPLAPVIEELQRLHAGMGATKLRLLAGNHDRGLPQVLAEGGLGPVAVEPYARLGRHILLHGDTPAPPLTTPGDGRILIGHEHPAIRLGDGVTSVKCPCFLVGTRVLVLPAFSKWAAGGNVRLGQFLSPVAKPVRFSRAVAILAGKLLPVEF